MCGHNLPLPRGPHSLPMHPAESPESLARCCQHHHVHHSTSRSSRALLPPARGAPLSTTAQQPCRSNDQLNRNEVHSVASARSCRASSQLRKPSPCMQSEKVATLGQSSNHPSPIALTAAGSWRPHLAYCGRTPTPTSSSQTSPSILHIHTSIKKLGTPFAQYKRTGGAGQARQTRERVREPLPLSRPVLDFSYYFILIFV